MNDQPHHPNGAEAVAALRESEERFRGMFEHARIGIAILDAEARLVRANPAYARMLGTTEAELIGRALEEVTHPEDRARQAELLADLIAGRRDHYQLDKRYVGHDGRVTWGQVTASAVRDAGGRVTSIIGTIQDMTDQRRALHELEEASTLRSLAGRVGRIGGWSLSLATMRMHWSDEVCAIIEIDPAESFTPEQAFAFYLPDSRVALERAFAACTTEGSPFDIECQLTTSTGKRRWVRVIAQARHGADGAVEAVEGALQDVTDQKALEAQFLRAQRLESVGVLAGGIAHDLNNVLTPILMSVDLLRLDERDGDRLQVLEGLEASARRGADMVRQVLTFARGAEGRRVTVKLRHIMKEVEKIITDTFPKNILLRASHEGCTWPVAGDPTQLHQVLVNLCVNARDAMPTGGTLGVRLEEVMVEEAMASAHPDAKPGPHVLVEVSDTGVGMTSDLLERIFDPFFTTKELGKGTGLGLSTSSVIVQNHGGFLTVESAPGEGSTFRVYLPALDEHPSGPRETRAPVAARGEGTLVLVVDDEPAVRTITCRSLERLGYRAIDAANGAEALTQFAARRDEIGVVLTDLMMPVMDGSTLIEMLVRMDPKVRVIAVSGVHQQLAELKEGRLAANVKECLTKPYSSMMLLEAISRAIR